MTTVDQSAATTSTPSTSPSSDFPPTTRQSRPRIGTELPHRGSTSSSSTVTVTPGAASETGTPTQTPAPASVSASPASEPPPRSDQPQSSIHPPLQPFTHAATPPAQTFVQHIVSPGSVLFQHTQLPAATRRRQLEDRPTVVQAIMDRRHPSSFQQLEKVSTTEFSKAYLN